MSHIKGMDRRKHHRISMGIRALIWDVNSLDDKHEVLVNDISSTGACITVFEDFADKFRVSNTLCLSIIFTGQKIPTTINFISKWIKEKAEDKGAIMAGCEFITMPVKSRENLDIYLEAFVSPTRSGKYRRIRRKKKKVIIVVLTMIIGLALAYLCSLLPQFFENTSRTLKAKRKEIVKDVIESGKKELKSQLDNGEITRKEIDSIKREFNEYKQKLESK
jgi:hypothetical protein